MTTGIHMTTFLNRRLLRPIEEAKRTEQPLWGRAQDGYTLRSGAPTSLKIRLEGEKRWRRLMVWQFSNAGTLFVKIKGRPFIVRDHDVPEP